MSREPEVCGKEWEKAERLLGLHFPASGGEL